MLTRLRNRKADAYAVIPKTPRYYGFLDPGDLVACLYASDGTWIADRGAIPLPAILPSAENGILLPTGVLAWRSADNELTVWDPDAAQTYTHTGASAYCSPPVHHDGRLWWVEFPAHEDEPDTNQATFTFRRSAPDLTGSQTVATVVFSALVQSWNLGPEAKVAASATGLLFESVWRDNINHEVADAAGARFRFGTSIAEARDGARIDLVQGLPAADGTSVGLFVPANTLRALSEILGAPSALHWPTTEAWALAEGYGQVFNAAVSGDGATALLYGYPPGSDIPIVIEAPATATTGEATIRVPIANHPIHGYPPTILFFQASCH
jgi:hypothetical protein